MRRNMLVGLSLAVAAVIAVLVGAVSDLKLESVALVGAAAGAVVALVPDRTPLARVAAFFVGFLASWVAYAVRALALPDTVGGRAVAVALVVVVCTAVVVASRDRLPLWGALLGAGTFAGSYELTYVAAPPEMAQTSLNTATTLLLMLAVGFLAAVAGAPAPTRAPAVGIEDGPASAEPADDSADEPAAPAAVPAQPGTNDQTVPLKSLMENPR